MDAVLGQVLQSSPSPAWVTLATSLYDKGISLGSEVRRSVGGQSRGKGVEVRRVDEVVGAGG